MKKTISILIALISAFILWNRGELELQQSLHTDSDSDRLLASAYEEGASDLQVEGEGVVIKILPDDEKGSRHQRFILQLDSGQTLLIAHNIDLAPRISSLRQGDRVGFYGEYEWTEQGGVIHWTHHDPRKRHIDGWLRHQGTFYQ